MFLGTVRDLISIREDSDIRKTCTMFPVQPNVILTFAFFRISGERLFT